MNPKTLIFIALCFIGGLLGGYFGWQQQQAPEDLQASTADLGKLEDINLPDTSKKLRNGKEWLGQVVVVNHWATWCPPCREEIPMLIDYQQAMGEEGVQVVGVAHDSLEATRVFGDEIGLGYPSLLAIANGTELLASHGNNRSGALPFTVVFDRQGKLVNSKLGKISARELHQMVQPLL